MNHKQNRKIWVYSYCFIFVLFVGIFSLTIKVNAIISDVNNFDATDSNGNTTIQVQIYDGLDGSGGIFQTVDPANYNTRLGGTTNASMTDFGTWYGSVLPPYPPDGDYLVCNYAVGGSGDPMDCDVNGGANASASFTYLAGVASNAIPPQTNPRIISFQPEVGETEGSNTVTLSADIFNDSAEYVRFSLQNFDTGLQLFPIDIPIAFSGSGTVSTTTTLDNGYYFGSVGMIGGGTQASSSPTVSFIVVETETSEGISLLPLATTTESNSLISQLQRLVINQETGIIARQAMSELYLELNQKLPFGFFTLIKDKIQVIADTEASDQADIVVNLGTHSFLNGTTTIFSWTDAKDFFDNVIPEGAQDILIYVEWIFASVAMGYIALKLLA